MGTNTQSKGKGACKALEAAQSAGEGERSLLRTGANCNRVSRAREQLEVPEDLTLTFQQHYLGCCWEGDR